jgi:hypothetical protein
MPVYDKLVAMKLVESETMNSVVERMVKFIEKNGGMK